MKLTTKQLKQIIKEELKAILDEDLPERDEWQDIMNDCINSGKDHYECIDLATQVYGRSWDDDTIKKHLSHEYGNKYPEKLHQKSEVDDIDDWITQSAADAKQQRDAAAEEAKKWEELYSSFNWAQIGQLPNVTVADRYEQIFGKAPDSLSHTRRIKRKINKWMNVHEQDKL